MSITIEDEGSNGEDFNPVESEAILRKWLDDDQLLWIVQQHIYMGIADAGSLPARISSNLARFVLSFFFSDLLAQRHIRGCLVTSLESRSGQPGLRALIRKLDLDPIGNEDEIRERAELRVWRRGGPRALKFTEFFGFPREFAGTKDPPSAVIPFEEVQARAELPDMHLYQSVLVDEMNDWLLNPTKNEVGGMLVLPTGTGKTRVACELITRYFKERVEAGDGQVRDVVLWIAHTKELCEQAHETITKMWQIKGSSRKYLNVYRFWDDVSTGELINARGVVVAGVQKLHSVVGRDEDAIILSNHLRRRLRLVIIDEAHLADNPSYVEILRFLGEGQAGAVETHRRRWMLLGLSATPFKSDERRNPALQGMFPHTFKLSESSSSEFVDIGEMGVFKWMQEKRYLKHEIDYRPLSIPKLRTLTPADIEHIRRFRDLSEPALANLTLDDERNEMIVNETRKAIDGGSKKILLFACSVPHCHLLRSSMTEKGMKSFTIVGGMSRQERTRVISAFRREEKEPIVLINYAILTTGFDDPKIDAVFITRPTWSRVLYHQMIGRGLRGERNGGNKSGRCLVLDVRDNFVEFEGIHGVVGFISERSAWDNSNRK